MQSFLLLPLASAREGNTFTLNAAHVHLFPLCTETGNGCQPNANANLLQQSVNFKVTIVIMMATTVCPDQLGNAGPFN